MMQCVICKKGIPHVDALFRINPKGRPALWVCAKHRSQTDAPRDPILDEIVDTIAKATP